MKPHKHAELIKQWADGAEIQECVGPDQWWDDETPSWHPDVAYRIKPQSKPDQIVYPSTATSFEGNDKYNWYVKGELKLVFDGETGKLKSAEVL